MIKLNEDLKIIKKKYGEKMMHLCRELFPTILEEKGLLPKILMENFAENKFLYNDIIENGIKTSFKNFIFSKTDIKDNIKIDTDKTPKELLEEAGYDFYECKTEEEIQKFKKYFKEDEELCTFDGGRLNNCHVFFAVKKNVNQIKRENFTNPQRQDEYGTSVISIQFTKDMSNTLSIKNRYNHTVENPDATFGNDLENIIPGLTNAFKQTYCIYENDSDEPFNLPKYVKANDGRYYKYNFKHLSIYYCPNNIIIDKGSTYSRKTGIHKFDKDSFIVFDDLILDLKKKIIYQYNERRRDSFKNILFNIKNIDIIKENDIKIIKFKTKDNEESYLYLDNLNQIVGYSNENIKEIGDSFLPFARKIRFLNLPNVQTIGNSFLTLASSLKEINLPNVKKIGNNFNMQNENIEKINMPNVEIIGDYFLGCKNQLKEISLPNVRIIGDYFLGYNQNLESINIPNLTQVGSNFLKNNQNIKNLYFPNLEIIGNDFLNHNQTIESLTLKLKPGKNTVFPFGFLRDKYKRNTNYKIEKDTKAKLLILKFEDKNKNKRKRR